MRITSSAVGLSRILTVRLRNSLKLHFPNLKIIEFIWILITHGVVSAPPGLLLDGSLLSLSQKNLVLQLMQIKKSAKTSQFTFDSTHFYSSYYLYSNKDIRDANIAPWLHYQVFGRLESRDPSPFLMTRHIAEQLSSIPRGEVVDEYLSNHHQISVSPSPYVEIESYITSGEWTQRVHPLTEILQKDRPNKWINGKLALIDSIPGATREEKILAWSWVLASHQIPTPDIKFWDLQPGNKSLNGKISSREIWVTPGYFIASASNVYHAATEKITNDSASVHISRTQIIAMATKSIFDAEIVMYSQGISTLTDIRFESGCDMVYFAPASIYEQKALEYLVSVDDRITRVSVLKFGVTYKVQSAAVHLIGNESPPHLRTKLKVSELQTIELQGLTIVLVSDKEILDFLISRLIRVAAERGWAVIAVQDLDLIPWASFLTRADNILATKSMIELATLAFSDSAVAEVE